MIQIFVSYYHIVHIPHTSHYHAITEVRFATCSWYPRPLINPSVEIIIFILCTRGGDYEGL